MVKFPTALVNLRLFEIRSAVLMMIFTVLLACTAESAFSQELIWVQTVNPGSNDAALAVAVHSSGVYVAGVEDLPCVRCPLNFAWRIEKRSPTDGSVGWAKTSDPSSLFDQARGIAVDDSGVFIVGVESITQSNSSWRIEKRDLSDGSLLWAQTSNPSSGLDGAAGVAVDASGIYVVGWDQSPGGPSWAPSFQWRIEKRDAVTGALLWEQTTAASGGRDIARAVAVDASGVYVAGVHAAPGDDEWRIEKRSLTDGTVIWVQTSNPSAGPYEEVTAIALDSDALYLVGDDVAPGDFEWRMEKRRLEDGVLLWVQTSNPSSSHGAESAQGVAVDGSGLYVVGIDSSPSGCCLNDSQWRIEKRSLTDGVLQWSKTNNPATYPTPDTTDGVAAVAVDNSGMYVVGWDKAGSVFGDSQWRIEKRDLGISERVSISVKPGSSPASIQPDSKGVIPVAILTTADFDAASVDPTTVRFGVNGIESLPLTFAKEDVDQDGDLDLILHFRSQTTGIVCNTKLVSITGQTFGGLFIYGSEAIRTAGCD